MEKYWIENTVCDALYRLLIVQKTGTSHSLICYLHATNLTSSSHKLWIYYVFKWMSNNLHAAQQNVV